MNSIENYNIFFTELATERCVLGPIIRTESPYLDILQSQGMLNRPK